MRPALRPGDGLLALRGGEPRPGSCGCSATRRCPRAGSSSASVTCAARVAARHSRLAPTTPTHRASSTRGSSGGCPRRVPTAWCGRSGGAAKSGPVSVTTVSPCPLACQHCCRMLSGSTQWRVGQCRRTSRSRRRDGDGVRSGDRNRSFSFAGVTQGIRGVGRWPDSTKEWAQVLMVAVRVASLPGLLATTTIFGAREELPDSAASRELSDWFSPKAPSLVNPPYRQDISPTINRRPC